jgi:hypothetical protein
MTQMTGHSLILTYLLVVGGAGQQVQLGPGSRPVSPSALKIIAQLDPGNDLRLALERGYTGDGIHRDWMDKMHRYGVRQASFVLRFDWQQGFKHLTITNQAFFRQYYQFDSIVKDRKLLREIRDRGLEKELREAVVLRAAEALPRLVSSVAQTTAVRPDRARGVLYLNLLDDGSLPILDRAPYIQWQFPRRDPNSAAKLQ